MLVLLLFLVKVSCIKLMHTLRRTFAHTLNVLNEASKDSERCVHAFCACYSTPNFFVLFHAIVIFLSYFLVQTERNGSGFIHFDMKGMHEECYCYH